MVRLYKWFLVRGEYVAQLAIAVGLFHKIQVESSTGWSTTNDTQSFPVYTYKGLGQAFISMNWKGFGTNTEPFWVTLYLVLHVVVHCTSVHYNMPSLGAT